MLCQCHEVLNLFSIYFKKKKKRKKGIIFILGQCSLTWYYYVSCCCKDDKNIHREDYVWPVWDKGIQQLSVLINSQGMLLGICAKGGCPWLEPMEAQRHFFLGDKVGDNRVRPSFVKKPIQFSELKL